MDGERRGEALPGARGSLRRLGTWRLLPFALVALGAIPLSYLPPDVPNTSSIAVATAITVVAFTAAAVLPWDRLPAPAVVLPPLTYLVAIAVLRQSEGGAASGYGPLVLIPLFWVALYGDRAQVATVAVGISATFLLPIVLVGAPEYPPTEWRRFVVWMAVAPTVGLLVNDLVRRIRHEAAANEQRARALDAVANISRSIGHGADVRSRICEAALDVGGGAASFLVEPDGTGRLLSTAVAGLELTEIVVAIGEEPSAIVTVYTSGERLFVPDATADPRVPRRVVEATDAASLLLEPVVRRGEVVGVLAILWDRPVEGPDHFAVMVTSFLATEAAMVVERSDLLQRLDRLARTDKLTGLHNRRAFDELVEREMARARRTGEPLALALLDLDRFKVYNDTYGHQAGDELLRAAAEAWSERLRDVDVLARWGGEEFVILLPDIRPPDTAETVVDRLRQATPMGQTCSAGVAVWDGSEEVAALVARADAALYRAKTEGRDRVVVAVGDPT